MPEQSSSVVRARVSSDPRVIVIDGYACSLTVSHGHLIIRSKGEERRISRIEAGKTRDGIARIIILARVGSVSIEAMHWAAALDVAIVQVSRDGSIDFYSPGSLSSDGRIIREQVLSGEGMPGQVRGQELTRVLLADKMRGQLDNARTLFHADTGDLDRWQENIRTADTIRAMLAAEGNAATGYWRLWKDRVFVPWDIDALKYVPAHWSSFNRRATAARSDGYTNTSNRNATDFVNACLNYGYKVAESEAVYACHILGLHPGIGVAHGVHDGKPGMALDLVEPLRSIVDRTVLSYLDYGNGIPFSDTGVPAYIDRECAYELEDGTCRLSAPMTTRLITAVSMAVAPHAMRYAELAVKTLAPGVNTGMRAPKDARFSKRPVVSGVLAPGIAADDLIPDAVWEAVAPYVPIRHTSGVPVDERTVLAGIVAHEIYGASWPSLRVLGIHEVTCQSRLTLWQETGVWGKIRTEITRPGISQLMS
jgi:CRISP-associated protein Cas1